MGWKVGHWGRALTAGLLAQACGCSSPAPSSDPEPISQVEQLLAKEQPPPVPGTSQAPAQDFEEALSCADINPMEPGPGRTLTARGNSYSDGYYYAECGLGTSDGAGYLALMNSFYFGVTAWTVFSPAGVPMSSPIVGGDMSGPLIAQPSGFQVSKETIEPGGLFLDTYSSQGAPVNYINLTDDSDVPFDMFPDPQGGVLLVTWEPREGNTQAVMYQFLDSTGAPRSERVELFSAPWAGDIHLIAGVDTLGRALLMWQAPGSGDRWVERWVSHDARPLTRDFGFLLPGAGGGLYPLAGGGLALRNDAGQWIARFPSGERSVEPAPAWLANHPGTGLILIHGQRANALLPPPSMIPGTGCQASLLTFTQDGTACGELLFPAVGSSCDGHRINVGLDGSVIQQLDPIPGQRCSKYDNCTPGPDNDDQCAWRWWPRLLH